MVMKEVNCLMFVLKYMFRTLHIISFAFMFGNVAYDQFLSSRPNIGNKYQTLSITFSVVIIISGLVNRFLLIKENKYKKDFHYKMWNYLLLFKLAASLFTTPLLDYFISLGNGTSEEKEGLTVKIKFTLLLVVTLMSPFSRFYREYCMQRDPEEYQM